VLGKRGGIALPPLDQVVEFGVQRVVDEAPFEVVRGPIDRTSEQQADDRAEQCQRDRDPVAQASPLPSPILRLGHFPGVFALRNVSQSGRCCDLGLSWSPNPAAWTGSAVFQQRSEGVQTWRHLSRRR